MTRSTKRERLMARAEYLQERLAQGHRNAAVLTRWRRELRRTRAMLLALEDGAPAGAYTEYLERVPDDRESRPGSATIADNRG